MKTTLLCFLAALFITLPARAQPVPIILDTDMAGDCDDAGALAVLHGLANFNEARILAVVTNRKDAGNASAAAVDAINTWYGRPNIPIGTDKHGARVNRHRESAFTPALRDEFPHDSLPDDQMPDALDVYRSTLVRQLDNSVVICSVGALSNLEDLLRSGPDRYSNLNGVDLIRQKVRQTVIMGGGFPRTSRKETNLWLDASAAVAVTNEWPGPILWQGYEIGYAITTGQELLSSPISSPVRRAYELRPYLDYPALQIGKPSHDQATVLLAVRGAQPELWTVVKNGRVLVDSDGNTEWLPLGRVRRDDDPDHSYVRIKGHPVHHTLVIGNLMMSTPRR